MTPSPSKRKGSQFERDVVAAMRAEGLDGAHRTRAGWQDDRGDIDGVDDWTIEAKNHQRLSEALSLGVDQAEVEATNAGTRWFAAVVKRRGRSARDAYVVLPLWLWCRLVAELLARRGEA